MSDDNLPTFDLLTAPDHCRAAFFEGRLWGRIEGLSEGFQRGWTACDDEISTLQRAAAEVVHRLAESPPRDVEADARRAERSRAWWAARRGEVVEP